MKTIRLSHHLLLPACLLIVAALACNAAQDPKPVVVTATPSNPALLNPLTPTVPYITPTPQILPTATLPPQIAFHDAESALRNGDYETAVDFFESVIRQQDADPDLRAGAMYGQGEAALREGLYAQSVEALTAFVDTYPQDPRFAQATFLRGDAYLGMSEWTLAITDFSTYLTLRPGLIDSYVQERIGDAYLALGDPQQSLDAYTKAADATREDSSLASAAFV
jgi:tetratricopeptide (TPR) repeat protein